MYFEFFYQIAPICIGVGVPFLLLLIGTALYNSLQIKKERARYILGKISPTTLMMLSKMSHKFKESLDEHDSFFKDFESKKSQLIRAIEIGNIEKIINADGKLLSMLNQYAEIKKYGVVANTALELRKSTIHASANTVDLYNEAAQKFNKSWGSLINRPVVALMNIPSLKEIQK